MSVEISELNLSVVKNIGESILELKKSIETPESNGEQCNENVSYLKVVASIKCWLDFQLLKSDGPLG